uniref:BPTI/Kunitz inhibitor domain-containing protein n=1 Tax=Canis lupus dingo TaxID=286419 RepID=A0A8C0R0K8_CANLU
MHLNNHQEVARDLRLCPCTWLILHVGFHCSSLHSKAPGFPPNRTLVSAFLFPYLRFLPAFFPFSPSSVKCPRTRIPCRYREIDQCSRSKSCPEKMTCCNFNCSKKCLDLKEDICTLPMNVGLCLALIPRWWYNKEYKRCYRFNYGGCSGNNNNFQSEAVCRAICIRKSGGWIKGSPKDWER